MIIKLNFAPNTELFDKPTNDYVNGFVHTVLGKNNKWHDSFSPYSVSTMHGGKYDKDTNMIQFKNGGFFCVSSDNEEFLSDFLCGLSEQTDLKLQTMQFIGFECIANKTSRLYDVVRITNIRLKSPKTNKEITFDDEDFLNILLEHSKKKLINNGISEGDVDTIKFQPFHKENWKKKLVKLKFGCENQSITPSSTIMLVIKGKKAAREKLINLGFGNSTGCGFGFATTKKLNKIN